MEVAVKASQELFSMDIRALASQPMNSCAGCAGHFALHREGAMKLDSGKNHLRSPSTDRGPEA